MFGIGREEAPERPILYDVDRLAVRAARRDPAAFEALYRKYVAQVYSFALYETRDHHAAEDVTEQIFLSALRGMPSFEERSEEERSEHTRSEHARSEHARSTFRAWLFRIARNTLANERRWHRRHPVASLDGALNVAAPTADPADQVAYRDLAARAWAAIDALPDERRQVIVLRFVEEMSAQEIGLVMGRSPGAVRVLVHRALRTVARRLG